MESVQLPSLRATFVCLGGEEVSFPVLSFARCSDLFQAIQRYMGIMNLTELRLSTKFDYEAFMMLKTLLKLASQNCSKETLVSVVDNWMALKAASYLDFVHLVYFFRFQAMLNVVMWTFEQNSVIDFDLYLPGPEEERQFALNMPFGLAQLYSIYAQ